MLQGIGIEEILEAIVKRIPAPPKTTEERLRALIFDSYYDAYKVLLCTHVLSVRGWHGALCAHSITGACNCFTLDSSCLASTQMNASLVAVCISSQPQASWHI